MAQVTHVLSPSARIDPYPGSLFRFAYEWSIREDYLARLQDWAAQSLLALVARHRPLPATLSRAESRPT